MDEKIRSTEHKNETKGVLKMLNCMIVNIKSLRFNGLSINLGFISANFTVGNSSKDN